TQLTRYSEVLASNICHILLREEEALWHADEALRIHPTIDGAAEYDRALPLLALGYTPQAIAALRRAWTLKGAAPDAEIAGHLLRAAQACEGEGLFASAEEAFAAAADAAPAGPTRDDALARLDAVRRRAKPVEAGALERAR